MKQCVNHTTGNVEYEYPVILADGRTVAYILAPTRRDAERDLRMGKVAGWYTSDAHIAPEAP